MQHSIFRPLSLSVLLSVTAGANLALAEPKCTDEPRDKWQDATALQKNLEKQGYKIKNFHVTDGNCYELYGWDQAGKKVEIYFNPVDGSPVKSNVEK